APERRHRKERHREMVGEPVAKLRIAIVVAREQRPEHWIIDGARASAAPRPRPDRRRRTNPSRKNRSPGERAIHGSDHARNSSSRPPKGAAHKDVVPLTLTLSPLRGARATNRLGA